MAISFTRRHFIRVAGIVKRMDVTDVHYRQNLAWEFASMFAEDNPRFDRQKFLAACGVL
jgi:hypothetical protein